MQSTTPELAAPTIRIAEEQPEFIPITGAVVNHPAYPNHPGSPGNSIVLAFRPSPEERQRIADGADVYVSLLTFGAPMQGIIVMAGKEEAPAIYNVRPLPAVEEARHA